MKGITCMNVGSSAAAHAAFSYTAGQAKPEHPSTLSLPTPLQLPDPINVVTIHPSR
jgi:hypothetical protein